MVNLKQDAPVNAGGGVPEKAPDPMACLCCGRYAGGTYYGQGDKGKVCRACLVELARQVGLIE